MKNNGTTAQRHNKTFLIMLVFGMFVHFNSNVLMAQTSNSVIQYVSQPTSMNVDQTKVFNYLSSLPYNDTLYFLSLDSILEINGVISLNLPHGNVDFSVKDVQFDSDTSYSLSASSIQGNFSLFEVNNVRGGLIDLGNVVYALYPYGQGMHVLMRYKVGQVPPLLCPTEVSDLQSVAACGTNCSENYVDVLSLVTPDAQLWLNNNWGTYGQWFLYQETHNFNLATFNSSIGGKKIRVRNVQFEPDFSYDNNHDIVKDCNLLINSPSALSLKHYFKCDIVVLLTNRVYFGYQNGKAFPVSGFANTINYNDLNKYCIVETPVIDPIRYNFAHEVAHQFGCWHDTDDNNNASGCPHGKSIDLQNGNTRKTIMALSFENYLRIPYFSNPDVEFMGVSSGEIGQRDNAHQIDGIAFCNIADNENLTLFNLNLNNSIICEDEPLNLYANITPGYLVPPIGLSGLPYGISPYQFEWTWSLNGQFTPSYFLGNQQSLYLSAPPNCPSFYIKCKIITSDGYTIQQRKRLVCDLNCPRESKKVDINVHDNLITIYPNPSNGIFNIVANSNIEKLEVFDLNFKLLKSLNLSPLTKSTELDLTKLDKGIYLLRLQNLSQVLIHKLIIVE